jgi:hypothetical protein
MFSNHNKKNIKINYSNLFQKKLYQKQAYKVYSIKYTPLSILYKVLYKVHSIVYRFAILFQKYIMAEIIIPIATGLGGFFIKSLWEKYSGRKEKIRTLRLDKKVDLYEDRLKKFYWPLYFRLLILFSAWHQLNKFSPYISSETRLKFEKDIIFKYHGQIRKIISKYIYLIDMDDDMNDLLIAYMNHINVYEQIRIAGISDKLPSDYGFPFPQDFTRKIIRETLKLQAEYDVLMGEAYDKDKFKFKTQNKALRLFLNEQKKIKSSEYESPPPLPLNESKLNKDALSRLNKSGLDQSRLTQPSIQDLNINEMMLHEMGGAIGLSITPEESNIDNNLVKMIEKDTKTKSSGWGRLRKSKQNTDQPNKKLLKKLCDHVKKDFCHFDLDKLANQFKTNFDHSNMSNASNSDDIVIPPKTPTKTPDIAPTPPPIQDLPSQQSSQVKIQVQDQSQVQTQPRVRPPNQYQQTIRHPLMDNQYREIRYTPVNYPQYYPCIKK